ncbi:TolB family protein [Natronosalvus vescus]|uniref:TolB family protein n=1 Tax=Natronosalvus vescus TaxID=2953881 RepID=UPI00209158FC|nr:hypothetical protein [Natronosalvus vescus]
MYDDDGNQSIAATDAWNYQQGSRVQWHPTQDDRILFNDVQDGNLVTRIVDVNGEEIDRYDWPLQAIAPTGEEFISLNYHRLDRNRPDYGYGLDDPTVIPDPSNDGLWRVYLDDGSADLLVCLGDLIDNDVEQANHYLNHVLYNPSGDRFVFLHRWRDSRGRNSRLYASDDIDEPLLDWSTISHYCWLDDEQLLVWGTSETYGSKYHVVDTTTGKVALLGTFEEYGDGHPSLSPDGQWIVTDTYPDRARQRHLLLYDRKKGREIEIGRFLSPFEYEGVNRCDLHPRWRPDGTAISIDSTHEGVRRSYIIDVSNIVND